MHHRGWKSVRRLLSVFLAPLIALLVATPLDLLAQTHVVSPADLQAALHAAAQARQANAAKVESVLASEAGRKAIEAAKADPVQVRRAVSLLSDEEMARLAALADQANFAGSSLSLTNEQLTIIIIGVIVIVLVAVLVSR